MQDLNRFKALANNIPQLAWMTDETGYIYWYNQRWFDFTGTTIENMVGWGWKAVHHPDHIENVVKNISECFENGTDWEDTFPLKRHDGVYRWFLSRASVIRDDHGKVLGWFGTNTDITEELEIKKQLTESERRFRNMVDTMDHMIWVTRPDGYHEYYNKRWYEFTGVPEGSTDGEEWNGMFHADDQDKAWEKWSHCLATGEPYEIEYRLRDKHGEYKWVLGRALPLRDDNGEIIKWCGTCTDIHALKDAELRAEEASRAKSEFLASMSHEIRTPLNAIIGVAGILSKGEHDKEKTEVLLRTLRNGSDGLLKLVNDVLDISKIEQRDFKLETSSFRLAEFLEEIISLSNVQAHEKGLALEVKYGGLNNTIIHTDPNRLRQVLINLVGNSLKFTEKGSVIVNTESDDKTLIITISDTGIGIPPEYLNNIFSKFERGKNVGNIPGTGLGLSICKHLVEMMGGTIEVKSEIGKGTDVILTFPYLIKQNDENFSSEKLIPLNFSNEYYSKKLLLVEDYEPNVIVMSTILDDIGINYSVARDGQEALQMLTEDNYGLVLMDINMPKMDGLETTQKYREWEKSNKKYEMPIIGLTAHVLSGDKDKCLNAGMDDYLTKPVSQDKLFEVINHYFTK